MEDIINIGTFVSYLNYYLKVGAYLSRDVQDETNKNYLQNTIKMHGRYKKIETSTSTTEKDEESIRKCLKRLNLVLKVNSDGSAVDLKNKDNQRNILSLQPCTPIQTGDLNQMIAYANKNRIDVLTDISLAFMLREAHNNALPWLYTQALFHISQLLLSIGGSEDNAVSQLKKSVYDSSAKQLEGILVAIAESEESNKQTQMNAIDKFLGSKIVNSGITVDGVNEAKQEVMEIFNRKGITGNNAMTKMIDSISSKLTGADLSGGNIFQNMIGIAESVANELRGDLEENPEDFAQKMGAIGEVFADALDESNKNGEQIPSEMKNMFSTLLSMSPLQPQGKNSSNASAGNADEIVAGLDKIVADNNLNRDEFYKNIMDTKGQIDVRKLEEYLSKM